MHLDENIEKQTGLKRTNQIISLRRGAEFFTLKVDEIRYVENMGRKLIYHSKTRSTEVYGKISEVSNCLGDSFYMIHRSYVVNMRYITAYTKQEVTLINGEKIPMSKYRYKDFVSRYTEYIEEIMNPQRS